MDINLISSSTAGTRLDTGGAPALKPSLQGVETENKSFIEPVEQVDTSTVAEKTVSQEKLEQVASELSDMMSLMRKGLVFKVDDNSGVNVVSVMDIDSGDVIRQIPSEEALELSEKLSEVTGFLVKTDA
ncbi:MULTISPECIES: flagellar protein FlaG [Shewanella]|uniref:flagellar protein FlaG n=1 Tax=Shewanella TaxID=22 RepID=UPI00217D29A1|nr:MULTISPECIES: flagellar protein FlaG [Shewanella]MCS6205539.1 flagellar protein FlaG [Shewanella baltica]WAL80199.1 flagellar protein FlaG [Shewanella sp. DAU305]